MKPAVKAALAAVAIISSLALTAFWLDAISDTPRRSAADVPDGPTSHETPTIAAGALYAANFVGTNGKTQTLAQWHDKLLVVNFWATWCGPCKEEMPLFARLQDQHGLNGLQIVGIAADSADNVAHFQKLTPVSYPLFPDESSAINLSKRLGNRFGLLPHTVVFAPKGALVFAKLGVVTEPEMQALFAKHLPKNAK